MSFYRMNTCASTVGIGLRMQRFLILSLVCVLSGCGSLAEDYVRKDKATWEGLQPCVRAGIAAVGTLDGRAFQALNKSWKARVDAGMEVVK
ncbi:hypothetical protein LCGC14_1091490 [marine sediment metagenome]|uniref:Lipoprotein n=1 Tax=marine sediment metagenome TaxID=412755 RepID=A0A0F9MGL7_9ZZZZ